MIKKTNKEYKKIVLAYSGGLDTSIIIPWLKENYPGCEVIAVSGNVGQVGELDGLEEKALKTGASKLYIEDLNKEFIEDVVIPSVQMGAKYENTYLLGTAYARPIIAKRLVEIAKKEGADAICHGCTGKGNDQVRFELAVKALAPDMPVIAPWRIWDIKGRDEEIDYAEAHNIPLKISRETNYSKDKNMWHLSHDAGNMEMGVTPEEAPDEGEYISIDFEKGVPVAVNGQKMDPVDLVWKLNELGGKHGVGIKCRGVYETPGGTILYHAHEMLEQLCLDKATQHYKQRMALEYADLVYNGQWFSPLREAMTAFCEKTQRTVTGTVKLKLYKGNIIGAGMTSPYSLYDPEIATFDEDNVYDQTWADGFITLYGLPTKVYAKMKAKNGI